MKRTILILVATALMVVLMATTVSPAFGQNWWTGCWGYGTDCDHDGLKRYEDNCPYGVTVPGYLGNSTDQTDNDGDGYGVPCDSDDTNPTVH